MTESVAPRTKRAMTAATTARLMAAARDAFATQGFANVAAEALTAELGLTRGALYHHFGGKEGLFAAVVRALEDDIAAQLTALWDAAPNPAAGLAAVCEGWLDLACDSGLQRILFRDAPAVLGPRASALDGEASRAALTAAIAAVPNPGDEPRDDEALARLLDAALGDLALWIAASDDPPATRARAGRALDRLLAGLDLVPRPPAKIPGIP
ncbi:TetR/AcrR family transcriptional regulator [Ponticoccus sp. SC2-23]|uniref:TetR/AcrR family transcriptional regulator n=1 Tax=Alexandriicola marinus TaxID=2081710 RepID=UPI0013E0B51B|nr:TetR/AcrR family transcriptional regulator [Alexandriicola marinus]MBM1220990.1 TetR/AcrR family transcriptional regulator [Ponticoccus sp. SC6-9]MBM1225560.1 TetR/AcrR family transcriptional regulator [Ponticoccus sp. SC6-15]MBM1231877.1 TetR/AcrR family transcriptional regulator [Ponticoccus sp. SC6-38]MBM1236402.1 TetR/AcrR family transcriptional regulator [Ponticoccus sp. SC6-45]MBM1240899.1 TetR/AcrR family transcriptional regulator [Ponticoccus sp. SC6-49]MBM1243483.1 TetR/AcrR famil